MTQQFAKRQRMTAFVMRILFWLSMQSTVPARLFNGRRGSHDWSAVRLSTRAHQFTTIHVPDSRHSPQDPEDDQQINQGAKADCHRS